jgi:acetyl esterase/lipase
MLPTDRRMNAFEMYSGDTPTNHPLLSPIYGDLSGLPPIFMQVGSTEILLDDTLRIARKARSQGVDVEVEVWNALPHVWHLWSYIPESGRALNRIARFFNAHFRPAGLRAVATD